MGGNYNCFETEVGLIIGRGGRTVDFGVVKAVFPENDLNVPLLIGRNPVFEEYKSFLKNIKRNSNSFLKRTLYKS